MARSLIAAHRGGALERVENSPTAFRHAAGLAVEQVEFDIHPTADGGIVVIHDATLDRTTGATGPVVARSLAELKRVVLTGTEGEHMLTLAELVELFRSSGKTLRMEVKYDVGHLPYPGLLARAVALLDVLDARGRTVVTSFIAATAGAAAAMPGLAGAIWLVSPAVQQDIGTAGIAAVARGLGIGAVGVRISHLDAAVMAGLAGLSVGAWAVNEAADIRKALGLGVSVFTTDRPSLAVELRQAGG
jgi:glycerophosphoryl diester phosphodiesterase